MSLNGYLVSAVVVLILLSPLFLVSAPVWIVWLYLQRRGQRQLGYRSLLPFMAFTAENYARMMIRGEAAAIIAGNEDYAAHREKGYGMTAPAVVSVARGAFYEWMKARRRLGGQNKVPRVLTPELEADFLNFAGAATAS